MENNKAERQAPMDMYNRKYYTYSTPSGRTAQCRAALQEARKTGKPGHEYHVGQITYVVQHDSRIVRISHGPDGQHFSERVVGKVEPR